MKTNVIFIAALSLSLASTASFADPSLLGTWRSDHDLTMKFLKDNVKLKPAREAFLDQLMGHLTLTFTDNEIQAVMPDLDIASPGKANHHLAGYNEKTPYKIIYTSRNVIVESDVDLSTGNPTVTILNFDGPDILWVYTGGADKFLPNLHFREYFRRIR